MAAKSACSVFGLRLTKSSRQHASPELECTERDGESLHIGRTDLRHSSTRNIVEEIKNGLDSRG